ncbi:hypothetical protein M2145_002827, partial [Lachnospiraceae bacterium PF1-21]
HGTNSLYNTGSKDESVTASKVSRRLTSLFALRCTRYHFQA